MYSEWDEFDWDDDNVEHIGRHGVAPWEAEESVGDPGRAPFPAHSGRRGVIGSSGGGRVLVVILEDVEGATGSMRRVVTARDATENEKRIYRRRRQ